jgi:hypothetical protein
MSNYIVGICFGVLSVLAAQKVIQKPVVMEVNAIKAQDLIDAYNRGHKEALRTNPVSFELEQTCLGLWAQKQPVE